MAVAVALSVGVAYWWTVAMAVVIMVATGCLRSGELLRAVRWDVILLLGSLSCFSVAMQKTGLAEALATALLHSLKGWPAYGVLLVVFVLGQLFTEALSNGTTVVGTYGTLKIGADGSYTYTVDQNNATVQALNVGSTALNDVFTYTVKDAAGLISTNTLTVTITGANDAPTVSIATAPASATNLSAFNFGTAGQANGFTQFDTTSSLYGSTIDGTLFGGLSGVRVDEEGFVVAQFTNGIERNLYKLPIATFANADGLGTVTGNSYRQTTQSGSPSMKAADEAGAGKISSKAVEQSTVDIAEEFSDMIIIQRAYSAASKIITTADEMLDELTRLKR
jgi:flagellar hook protein FlgE